MLTFFKINGVIIDTVQELIEMISRVGIIVFFRKQPAHAIDTGLTKQKLYKNVQIQNDSSEDNLIHDFKYHSLIT